MAKDKKITDQDIRDCLARDMKVLDIAEKYDVTVYTVLRKMQKMDKEEQEQEQKQKGKKGVNTTICRKRVAKSEIKNSEARLIPYKEYFEIKVGDTISAIEPEISPKRYEYLVIGIYEDIYIGKRIVEKKSATKPGGNWCTAFRIRDYKRGHDPHLVKLVKRKGEGEEQ